MKFSRVAALSALVFGVTGALAVPVTVSGTHFDISYDSAQVGLFGTPDLSGSRVVWVPTGSPSFLASTVSDVRFADSTFALQVTAKPGFTLTSLSLLESGTYAFYGTHNLVATGGDLRVIPLTPPGATRIDDIIVTSGAFLPQASASPFPARRWEASAALALPTDITWVNASIASGLFAFAADVTPGDYARIALQNIVLDIGVIAVVPEPETYAMLLSGLGLVGFLALRRRHRD